MIYVLTMSNNREVTVRAPSSGRAIDFALAQYPGANVLSVGQIPEVDETDETDETEEDDDE